MIPIITNSTQKRVIQSEYLPTSLCYLINKLYVNFVHFGEAVWVLKYKNHNGDRYKH